MNSKVPMVAGKPYGRLSVSLDKEASVINIIQVHPQAPENATTGYIVAKVTYSRVDAGNGWEPTPETAAYAQLFAAAPKLAELLYKHSQHPDAKELLQQIGYPGDYR